MDKPLTADEIDELEALLRRASGLPWQQKSEYEPDVILANVDGEIVDGTTHYTYDSVCDCLDNPKADAPLIVAAVNALPRLLASARMGVVGWQPIETAPKDGTRILVCKWAWVHSSIEDAFSPENLPPDLLHLCWAAIGHWSTKWNNWNDGVEPSGLARPTHWRPLPEPPLDPSHD